MFSPELLLYSRGISNGWSRFGDQIEQCADYFVIVQLLKIHRFGSKMIEKMLPVQNISSPNSLILCNDERLNGRIKLCFSEKQRQT